MREGWRGDDHLILFDETEVSAASHRYSISDFLPGFGLVGLRGWGDFIVRDSAGSTFCVPTVPLDPQYLSPFSLPDGAVALQPDVRFESKIKWYVKPIVFGGDPSAGDNCVWVSHEQHAQLVRWWNDQYRALAKT